MRIIDLAIKDLRQLARDRKTFVFLLVMPMFFTVLFGVAFGGNNAADPRLPIQLLDLDQTPLSLRLSDQLEASQVVRLEPVAEAADSASLERLVADESIAAALIIAPGFSSALLDATQPAQPPLLLVAGGQTAFTVEAELQTALTRLQGATRAAQLSVEMALELNAIDTDRRESYFNQGLGQALEAWLDPPVSAHSVQSTAISDEADAAYSNYSVFAHSSPGMMGQFALAALMGASAILVLEKKQGTLRRLMSTSMGKWQVMAGHFLAMFAMILMQLISLMIFGQLVLSLPYASQLAASLLVTFATALFAASLGLCVGAIARSEQQALVFTMVPMFLLSALGGAWVPLEFTPEAFQQVAYVTPLAWVVDGYKDILVRGQGVNAVLVGVAVLVAYSAGLTAITAWRFRFE